MEKKKNFGIMEESHSLQEMRAGLLQRISTLSHEEQLEVLKYIEGGALHERCAGSVVLGR